MNNLRSALHALNFKNVSFVCEASFSVDKTKPGTHLLNTLTWTVDLWWNNAARMIFLPRPLHDALPSLLASSRKNPLDPEVRARAEKIILDPVIVQEVKEVSEILRLGMKMCEKTRISFTSNPAFWVDFAHANQASTLFEEWPKPSFGTPFERFDDVLFQCIKNGFHKKEITLQRFKSLSPKNQDRVIEIARQDKSGQDVVSLILREDLLRAVTKDKLQSSKEKPKL